jgi:putative ABC transport system permease protein
MVVHLDHVAHAGVDALHDQRGALARMLVRGFETELYRVPFVIEPSTYGSAILIGIGATAASVLLVRQRLDRLDLIGVLKTRE